MNMNKYKTAAVRRNVAAKYIGVSAAHFDKLVAENVMPRPKNALGVKLWLIDELNDSLAELSLASPSAAGSGPCKQDEFALKI